MYQHYQKEIKIRIRNKYWATNESVAQNDYFKIIKELDDYILTIKCDNNELLSKAINYYLNQKDELYTYLDCGYTDMQPGRKGCLGLCHCKEFFLIL